MGSKYTSAPFVMNDSNEITLNKQSSAWYIQVDGMNGIHHISRPDFIPFIEFMIRSYNEAEGTNYKISNHE